MWGDATGKMGPSYNIIKMDVKGTDLSTSRVLSNLHKVLGFTEQDGWKLCMWEKTLTLNVKSKPTTAIHRRPYLIHSESLVIITVQIRAWMDSTGLIMWIDQLGPYFKKRRGKAIVVWDNCGSHNVTAVVEAMAQWGLEQEHLPKNMTDVLQVMDLVVNGPVKAGIRRKRIEVIFNYFQNWKIKRLQHAAVPAQQELPPAFAPPKPTQAEGIKTVLEVLNTTLTTEKFQESMRRCFVAVGLAPDTSGAYVQYSPSRKGYIASLLPQVQNHDHAISVGEISTLSDFRM